jgi:hypothetical protein
MHRRLDPAIVAPPRRKFRTLLSPAQLNEAMVRESTRVDRKTTGASSLSMVLFRLPDRKNHRAVIRLAHTILRRIRVTDDLGWFDKQHLGLLLPDTPSAGAWRLAQDVCDIVAQHGERPLCTMYTYPDAEEKTIIRSEPIAAQKVAS